MPYVFGDQEELRTVGCDKDRVGCNFLVEPAFVSEVVSFRDLKDREVLLLVHSFLLVLFFELFLVVFEGDLFVLL